jgi:hypothetical protein
MDEGRKKSGQTAAAIVEDNIVESPASGAGIFGGAERGRAERGR